MHDLAWKFMHLSYFEIKSRGKEWVCTHHKSQNQRKNTNNWKKKTLKRKKIIRYEFWIYKWLQLDIPIPGDIYEFARNQSCRMLELY